MDVSSIKSAYKRYARHYDRFFGPIFNPGRKLAVQIANPEPEQRILEVGVGTGLSLPYYRQDAQVVGIDISTDMLDIARQRADDEGLQQVEDLLEMDAEDLRFDDNTFDCVVAMYVASVVPNPDRLIAEMRRVCRPGGDILIINHFASRNPVLRGLERGLRPLSKLLGFRPDMDLDVLPDTADFPQLEVRPTNLGGYWKLVHYRNGDPDSATAAAPVDASAEPAQATAR